MWSSCIYTHQNYHETKAPRLTCNMCHEDTKERYWDITPTAVPHISAVYWEIHYYGNKSTLGVIYWFLEAGRYGSGLVDFTGRVNRFSVGRDMKSAWYTMQWQKAFECFTYRWDRLLTETPKHVESITISLPWFSMTPSWMTQRPPVTMTNICSRLWLFGFRHSDSLERPTTLSIKRRWLRAFRIVIPATSERFYPSFADVYQTIHYPQTQRSMSRSGGGIGMDSPIINSGSTSTEDILIPFECSN